MMAAGSNGSTHGNPWAGNYYAQGLQVVPGRSDSKRPLFAWKEFEEAQVSRERFDSWFGEGSDYDATLDLGILTGPCSLCGVPPAMTAGLFVLDCDEGEEKHGIARWLGFVVTHLNGMEPETWTARSGGGGLHFYFLAPPDWIPPTIKLGDWDVRGVGGYVVAPPSLHASGKRYEWLPGRAPWETSISFAPRELLDEIDRLRAGGGQTVNGQRVEVEGTFDQFGAQIDGRETRMRDTIWGVACDLRRTLWAIDDPAGQPLVESERERAWSTYLFAVKTNLAGVSQEEGLEREGHGRSYFDDRWRRAMGQWNGRLKEAAGGPKPEPRPKVANTIPVGWLDPWGRTPLAEFPLDRVPAKISAYAEAEAASLGVSPAGPAIAGLTTLSGAIDQGNLLHMWRRADWFVRPRLWTVFYGHPGTRKSPIIKAAVGPLAALENKHARAHAQDMARWKERKEAGEDEPPPPSARRNILNDTTPEAAAAILARQDCGILAVDDELSGFSGERYHNNAAFIRSFWAKAYDGGPFVVDRKAGSMLVNNLCSSFLAGIQPGAIESIRDLLANGLWQRFNPIMLGRPGDQCDIDDELPLRRYSDLVSLVSYLKPITIQMEDDAIRYCEAFRTEIREFSEQFDEDDASGFTGWLDKLGGTQGSLAMILHIIERREDYGDRVDLRAVENAAAIIREFLIPHAMLFYDEISDDAMKPLIRKVAGYILRTDLPEYGFSDLKEGAKLRKEIKHHQDMRNLMAALTFGGWVAEDEERRKWTVRQGLREIPRFVERREIELSRTTAHHARFEGKQSGDQP